MEDWFDSIRGTRLGHRKRRILLALTRFRPANQTLIWTGPVSQRVHPRLAYWPEALPYARPPEATHELFRRCWWDRDGNARTAGYRALASLEASGLIARRRATPEEVAYSRSYSVQPLTSRSSLWRLTDLGLAVVRCYSQELSDLERKRKMTPIHWDRKRIEIYYAGIRKSHQMA